MLRAVAVDGWPAALGAGSGRAALFWSGERECCRRAPDVNEHARMSRPTNRPTTTANANQAANASAARMIRSDTLLNTPHFDATLRFPGGPGDPGGRDHVTLRKDGLDHPRLPSHPKAGLSGGCRGAPDVLADDRRARPSPVACGRAAGHPPSATIGGPSRSRSSKPLATDLTT